LNNFLSQLLILILIYTSSQYFHGNLLILGLIFSVSPIVIFLLSSFFFFSVKAKIYLPSLSFIKPELFRNIFSLSLKFFIIQINMLVLFQTSNFLIIRLYGPEEVVKYNVAFNFFSLINLAFSTISTPYWAAFIEAYTLRDFEWIKKSIMKLKKIWFVIVSVGLLVLILSDKVYYLWLHQNLDIPFSLSMGMYLFHTVFAFGYVYNTFINSTGKILVQVISMTFFSILFIPLVIFFAKVLVLGIVSLPLALLMVSLYTMFIAPYQAKLIIAGKASGIFNR
ncbi:MAG: hypothetical protein ACP5K4_09995, partial [Caldisericum sp.]